MLELIDQSTQYLSNIIDRFRNYIKEKKEYKDVIVQDRVKIALDIVAATLKNHKIKLINDIDKIDPQKVSIIVGELSEVVVNLIKNSKDAILQNNILEPYIKIYLEQKDHNIVINIEDNGGGISQDIIGKIFDPYFTTKHKSRGTGLGLYISKKIIEEHFGGKLYLKNTKEGACFSIELSIA